MRHLSSWHLFPFGSSSWLHWPVHKISVKEVLRHWKTRSIIKADTKQSQRGGSNSKVDITSGLILVKLAELYCLALAQAIWLKILHKHSKIKFEGPTIKFNQIIWLLFDSNDSQYFLKFPSKITRTNWVFSSLPCGEGTEAIRLP